MDMNERFIQKLMLASDMWLITDGTLTMTVQDMTLDDEDRVVLAKVTALHKEEHA